MNMVRFSPYYYQWGISLLSTFPFLFFIFVLTSVLVGFQFGFAFKNDHYLFVYPYVYFFILIFRVFVKRKFQINAKISFYRHDNIPVDM